ncbi:multidrug resistance protein B [Bordetella trematum]|uniref:Multidrug resistance protein B n=1 Tax=Bordetella trematum TaxID=123899 RepID=A0A157ST13_9BORD|nr:DHA2 family efflux MFS transporter permease subunit [Bordetella trematum]AZR94492.1 multidrug resistance protein B [Bordetella trematum]NNH20778.1 DHA2 family efflux MFS transporter permease subunit [Bordetella trematum]SAI27144.1 multidrug resistance protein B [Bordetella trematum]SAI73567.1 multidrug resistance protein B [Bordetella trematum]SUV97284.1 multidrug resistance protein B [Bordetella trematum]
MSEQARKAPGGGPYPPLEGATRIIGSVALSTAVFMNVLDTSIANVSIPTISGDLGVSSSQGTWVITSFAVANAITVPLTGWLTQRFGQVRLFVISTILFVLASWLCGFSPTLEALIGFRVLQGLVAGPMIPLSQALMLAAFPREKSGMALAIWSMTTLVAPVAGPLLGGWISDNYSWPWIFYINVPVGLLAAWISWRIFRDRESLTRKLPIDKIGLLLLVLWVGALQIMLDKGKELDWFASPVIQALAALAIVAFVFFLIWELTDAHPVVDLRLFKERNFTVGALTLAIAYGVFFGNVVLLPLWLQSTMGYTATYAGLITAPVGFLAILLTPIVGKLLATRDPRQLVTLAFLIFALVCFMRSGFNPQTDVRSLMTPTIIQGAAMAMFFVPLTSITLSGLEPGRIPAASGLSNFLRLTAGAFGTSIATTAWDDRATLHHARLTEVAQPGQQAFDQTMGALQNGLSLTHEQSLHIVDGMIGTQAHTMAAVDVFYASGVIFVLLIVTVWFARPKSSRKKPGQTADDDAAQATAGAH